jgi:molybdopterin converting factor subunit 1
MNKLKIKIKYYAYFKEFTGKEEEILDVPEESTLNEIRDFVKSLYEKIRQQEQVLVAVNGSFKPLDTVIHEGDLVSFFPPVSGG